VSGIEINFKVKRFDKDLFSIDTTHTEQAIDVLEKKYPSFIKDYLFNILAAPPNKDSAIKKVNLFIHDYMPLYDSATAKFASMDKEMNEVKKALQFAKYYFPQKHFATEVITFIGPLEGYGNVLTDSAFLVGLQAYMGKNFSAYHTDYIEEVYPSYITRRFEPNYIAVNCMKNLIDYLFEDKSANLPLVYKMIEEGKRMYVLDMLLPRLADSVKTGYTQQQLDGCYQHEAGIWNYFCAKNNLLFTNDPIQQRDYIFRLAKKTEALGEASPGNIGLFVGWQIVKKWMQQNKQKSLEALMNTEAKQIFDEAKYKPR